MKLLLVAFFACLSIGVFAQMPKPTTAEIKTPEATCAECKAKIEASVKDQVDGLIKINVVRCVSCTQCAACITSGGLYKDLVEYSRVV